MMLLETLSRSPVGETVVLALGLIFGSFFNVCIHRLPREQSVVFPRSYCPQCQVPIPWYLNVPLISFLWLRGRCRFCRVAISIEYPLVELGTAALFLWLYLNHGWSKLFFARMVFLSALWVASIIDLHHQIIPDEISIGGMPVGLVASFWLGQMSWWEPVLGVLLGGGSFLAVSWIYEKLTGREGLGGGDVKLLSMIGAWLGVKSILPVIVVSSAAGSIVGIAYMVLKKKGLKEAIPFGPFLAIGAVAECIWGEVIHEYFFPFPL